MIRLLTLLFLLCAAPLAAQDFPAPLTPYVNDFADLLPEADEAQLTARLENLRTSHGVEMTVVTLRSRADYGPSDTIEEFATGLFNAWGVGDATRNHGILVLVARQDREMRIELGSGYDSGWDWQARVVIEDYFLPSFRADNYLRGILTGTAQTIERIAIAHATGAESPRNSDAPVWIVAMLGFIAVLGLALRNTISDRLMAFRRCPNCAHRGLQVARDTLTPASLAAPGQGRRELRCPACDHHDTTIYVIPRMRPKSSSGGSFGGGSSSGGGASGRW